MLAALLLCSAGCAKQTGVISSTAVSQTSSQTDTGVGFDDASALESAIKARDQQNSSSDSAGLTSSDTAPAATDSSSAPAAETTSSSTDTTTSATEPTSSTEPEKPATVWVTIPEGFTIDLVAARLEKNGVCSASDFIQAAQSYSSSDFPLVNAIPSSSKRAYKLEGYLYPAKYEFYTDMTPEYVLEKFLRASENNIDGEYSYSGMTTDQVVTLASIIQGEATSAKSMQAVSMIFHNRLKIGQQLEADATRLYCTQVLLAPNGPFADEFKYYYNTYRCSGLPAGPICNPGSDALYAATHPDPSYSDYYYFFTTSDGSSDSDYHYQKTLDEHEAELVKYGLSTDDAS